MVAVSLYMSQVSTRYGECSPGVSSFGSSLEVSHSGFGISPCVCVWAGLLSITFRSRYPRAYLSGIAYIVVCLGCRVVAVVVVVVVAVDTV